MLTINEIFENGRTCSNYSSKEVSKDILESIYNLMKLGPTSGNCSPLRIKFVSSKEAREKLLSCVMEGNLEKTKSAPVTALFAMDENFYEKLDILFPHNPGFKTLFVGNEAYARDTAYRNSTLQAAYFMMIARSFGLDCGPMSGFDGAKINEIFFPNSSYKVNFICNLGYKAGENPHERLPRLNFEETCEIV